MSELLPPITGTGVLLRFVFPFDGSVPRDALIIWQRQVGGSLVEEKYASISQAGASTVVHEQITFPGDVWAVRESGGGGRLLALHVATGEREQQVVIGAASMAAAATTPRVAEDPPDGAGEEDEELAAALRESLLTAANEATTASAAAHYRSALDAHDLLHAPSEEAAAAMLIEQEQRAESASTRERRMREAVALSKRLADDYRARQAASALTAGSEPSSTSAGLERDPAPPVDAEAVRAARLRRFTASN